MRRFVTLVALILFCCEKSWFLKLATFKDARYSFAVSMPLLSLSINYVAINKDLEKLPP